RRHDLGEIGTTAVRVVPMRGQLLKIVAGGEGRSGPRDDHRAHRWGGARLGNRPAQRGDHVLRETIPRLRPIERQEKDGTALLAQEKLKAGSGDVHWLASKLCRAARRTSSVEQLKRLAYGNFAVLAKRRDAPSFGYHNTTYIIIRICSIFAVSLDR